MNLLIKTVPARLVAAMAAFLAACAQAPLQSIDDQAWVQAAAGGAWMVRANTAAANCPTLSWEGGALPMRLRAAPASVPASQAGAKPAVFTQRSCELELPAGARQLRVGGLELAAPVAEPRRLLLLGDTGCRMKASENAFQDCNDPAAWPYAAVVRRAAAMQPDLVIHVGDMHYRESPCPADRAGCAGSPWGYGDDAWQADFFAPSAPLLKAAPWVMVRGNHESCARAGLGWFRYLDAHAWQGPAACEDFTAPFVLPLDSQTQLIVFDSSAVVNRAYPAGDAALQRYQAQLRQVEQLSGARPHNFLLHHHPVLGFSSSADGPPAGLGGPALGHGRPASAALLPARREPGDERARAPVRGHRLCQRSPRHPGAGQLRLGEWLDGGRGQGLAGAARARRGGAERGHLWWLWLCHPGPTGGGMAAHRMERGGQGAEALRHRGEQGELSGFTLRGGQDFGLREWSELSPRFF